MKTARQIAEEAADKIEPGLSPSVLQFADTNNAEIKHGRDVLIRRREQIIEIVTAAITSAIEEALKDVPKSP